jgi:hypothetical protein
MRRDIIIDILPLFAEQFGLAAWDQIRAAGVTPEEIRHRIAQGEWREVCPGVIGIEGIPAIWEQGPMAIHLTGGRAAVSFGTGLRLHGLDGFDDFDEVHALTTKSRRLDPPSGTVVHRSRRFHPATQVVLRQGIRTTNVATSLVLSAGFHADDRVGKALDDALRRGTSPVWLSRTTAHWAGRGVPGSRVLAGMLASRVGVDLPRSWYERLAKAAFDRTGVELLHEHAVLDGRRKLCSIDLAAPSLLVGVECQSTRWHADPTARHHDLRRKRRLRELGWDIVEVWYADLERFDDVLADVLIAIDRQQRLLVR